MLQTLWEDMPQTMWEDTHKSAGSLQEYEISRTSKTIESEKVDWAKG